MLPDVVAGLQQQGNGELGHGPGAVAGYVAHGNPPLRSGLDVHHIEARGQNADVADAWAAGQHLAGHRRLVGQDNIAAVYAAHDLLHIVQGGAVVDGHLAQSLEIRPAQVAGVQTIAVQYYDFHDISSIKPL